QQFGNRNVSKRSCNLRRQLGVASVGSIPMIAALQFLCAVASAVAMSLALAHALELPGKLRLGREQYLAVQAIYYPGFTIGGVAEPLTIITLGAWLLMLPAG